MINNLIKQYYCHFSLYVDDMTFSSHKSISLKLRDEVAIIKKKHGLKAKPQKDHYYQAKDFKVVTGVGIRDGNKIVLNGKRKKIIDIYEECKKNPDIYN